MSTNDGNRRHDPRRGWASQPTVGDGTPLTGEGGRVHGIRTRRPLPRRRVAGPPIPGDRQESSNLKGRR